MPAYVYRCPRCSWKEEHAHGINDEPTYRCPACVDTETRKGTVMVRVIQPVGFRTPGEGFFGRGRV